MTLTEFLLARIAEDEAVARAIVDYWPPVVDDRFVEGPGSTSWAIYSAESDYVERITPARVLAECEAKRVAVDWYENDDDTVMGPTVRAMAAVYADHPDYREEWRP